MIQVNNSGCGCLGWVVLFIIIAIAIAASQ